MISPANRHSVTGIKSFSSAIARATALLLLLSTLAGCSSQYIPKNDVFDHVIAVDGQGRPHDPRAGDTNGPSMCMDAYREQIKCIFLAMREFHKKELDNGKTVKKVLIFVHGGLNDPHGSLQSADGEICNIEKAGYFPIFLDWDSGIWDTYGEHIARITQGLTDDSDARKLLTPFYLIGDAGRALARAPVVWSSELENDVLAVGADLKALGRPRDPVETVQIEGACSERWANRRRGKELAKAFIALRSKQLEERRQLPPKQPHKQIQISIGPDLGVSGDRMAARAAAYVITSPLKFVLSPLIDFLGTPAWQNMARRTLMAFDGQLGGSPGTMPPPATEPSITGGYRVRHATNFDNIGALEVFREELLKTLRISDLAAEKSAPHYEITLIAHSAGTLALNEWLRRDALDKNDQLYSHIVYLAAACSVRDFQRSVVPYLIRHPETQFYNLMLHPLADLRETAETKDLAPRGSLLVWLDEFLTDPQTPLDRTLGRWDNIVPSAELLPEGVRGQITLKSFTLAPYDQSPATGQSNFGPQVHGGFRGSPYWCPDFWKCESPIIPGLDCCMP